MSSARLAPYISAAVALVALLLGIKAYSAWKVQELAKRNANNAMQVLQSATAAHRCVDRAIAPDIPPNADDSAIEKIARYGAEDMQHCRDLISAYAADVFLAEITLDSDTHLAAFSLYFRLNSLSDKYDRVLTYLRRPSGPIVLRTKETREQIIERLLNELGSRKIIGEDKERGIVYTDYRDPEKNPYPELNAKYKELVQVLGRYIRFDGPNR